MRELNIKKQICIFGTGGSGRDTLCCLADCLAGSTLTLDEVACFMVGDEYYKEENIMGIRVVPLSKFETALYNVVVAVGNPAAKKNIVENLPSDTTYASIIHPTAIVSSWVDIGEGCIIAAGAVLTCNIRIGKHAQLNLNTTVCHDCIIGDFFTSGPAVNISGNCEIGDEVYFGTNSSIREKTKVCDRVTIGMGSVVVKDIFEEGTYVGNPAKKLKN